MPASSAMIAAAKARRVHPVIELTYSGTVYRFAEEAVCSLANGLYLPYVTSQSDVSRMANPTEGTLEVPTFNFRIHDADRVLQKLFGGPSRGRSRGALVERWWRSFDVEESDHYRTFQGIVLYHDEEGRDYSFYCRADTTGFDAPMSLPYVPEEDWSDAPETTIGAPLWAVYGTHSSAGVTESHGMIPCLPAKVESDGDTVLEWIAAMGANSAVPNVYIGDDLRTSDFSVSNALRGRNYYQMVTYTGSAPKPTKSSSVRVDIDGLTDDPDGTGTLITNPAAQLRHAMALFGYGDGDVRPLASWPSETGLPIDSDVLDDLETHFAELNWPGTLVVYAGQTLREVVEGWCKTWVAAPYFTDAWGFGAFVRKPGARVVAHDAPQLVSQKLKHVANVPGSSPPQEEKLRISNQRQGELVTDIELSYLLDEARNTFARSGLVAWRRSGITPKETTLELTYGKRSL